MLIKPNGGAHQTIVWVTLIVAALLMWQSGKLHPALVALLLLIILGILLRFEPTIKAQFQNLGK